MVEALHRRQLPKRAAEIVAADLPPVEGAWVTSDAPLKRAVEDRLAEELGLEGGAAFVDYPRKEAMFRLDLLVHRRGGEVLRLGPGGRAGLIGLPRVADELYRTARVLRLFTMGGRRSVDAGALAGLIALSDEEARSRLEGGRALLG